jgi:hypothetical protein
LKNVDTFLTLARHPAGEVVGVSEGKPIYVEGFFTYPEDGDVQDKILSKVYEKAIEFMKELVNEFRKRGLDAHFVPYYYLDGGEDEGNHPAVVIYFSHEYLEKFENEVEPEFVREMNRKWCEVIRELGKEGISVEDAGNQADADWDMYVYVKGHRTNYLYYIGIDHDYLDDKGNGFVYFLIVITETDTDATPTGTDCSY